MFDRDAKIRARLEAFVASKPGDNRDETKDYHEDVEEFWDILGVPYGSYNSAVDEHIIYVIERMMPTPHAAYTSEIAKDRGWPEEYVELIKYILCSAGLAEYGTSPRGAWICHSLVDVMPKVIDRWRSVWTENEEGDTP